MRKYFAYLYRIRKRIANKHAPNGGHNFRSEYPQTGDRSPVHMGGVKSKAGGGVTNYLKRGEIPQ
jgi:hypothetical protein